MWARCGAARGSCWARDTPRCDRCRPPLPAPVGRLAPRPYGLAAGPRGLVPPPPPRRGPCRGPPCRPPRLPRGRHRTDRTPVHPAPEPALGGRASAPLPRAGLGLGGVPSGRVGPQAPRLGRCPGLPVGRGEAAPPPRRRAPPDPVRRPQRERQPTLAPRFCRASGGAGLGCPCGARGPLVCGRGSARRRVSSRRRRAVTPGASPPSAARARGHPSGGGPEGRGEGGRRGWSQSPGLGARVGATRGGRVDGGVPLPSPCAGTAVLTWRTVWPPPPTRGAMGWGDHPRARASLLGARRTPPASATRRAAANCRRASSVQGRTARAGFLAHATPAMPREHRLVQA
jgi:hypothetical protein